MKYLLAERKTLRLQFLPELSTQAGLDRKFDDSDQVSHPKPETVNVTINRPEHGLMGREMIWYQKFSARG